MKSDYSDLDGHVRQELIKVDKLMATVENVNIEINAALKAENERLKEEQKLWVDYYNTISKLQADKAEHRQIILRMLTYLDMDALPKVLSGDINELLSKHDTKRPD